MKRLRKKGFRPKIKTNSFDSLEAYDKDAWDCVCGEVEKAYRRGFYQGAAIRLKYEKWGMTDKESDKWMWALHGWRYSAKMWCEFPPEPSIRAQQ